MNTKESAILLIVWICFLNKGSDIFAEASYNIGGRKIRKTISGFNVIASIPGKNPNAIHPSTKNTG